MRRKALCRAQFQLQTEQYREMTRFILGDISDRNNRSSGYDAIRCNRYGDAWNLDGIIVDICVL